MQVDSYNPTQPQASEQEDGQVALDNAEDSWLVFGHVRFEGVGLQYNRGDSWALQDVDLELQPGESVGIVGRTGQASFVTSFLHILYAS